MSKIKSLPSLERPREKAFHYGIEKLSDYELIAILIGSGTFESSAIDIAYQMIQDNRGLYNLVQKPFSDLLSFKGIGKSKAVKIFAAFEIAKRFNSLKVVRDDEPISSDKIYEKYKYKISDLTQEHLYLVVLDRQKRVVHEVNLFKGNENAMTISKIKIIQQVLIHNGRYFYLIHNHPSGSYLPSPEDINFTTDIIQESEKLKITMLDHIIIGEEGYFSFKTTLTN